jgi:hypothetical protein
MGKWLTKFLENKSQRCTDNTDITDRFTSNANMSVLSVPSVGVFYKNPVNISKVSTDSTDITDRFIPKTNMSVLSVPSGETFYKNLGNISKMSTDNTDITDRFIPKANMSVLSGSSLLDSFEERLAIAEYDGRQTHLQAQRIAYLDAFMAVLSALHFEEEEGHYDEDWLTRRVKATQYWLETEGLQQPK